MSGENEKVEKTKKLMASSFLVHRPTPAVGMKQITFERSFENSRLEQFVCRVVQCPSSFQTTSMLVFG